ncbi:MAG TPA: LLM class flavin-dependent oxidoreductase [Candidatus Limnocylindrales bacterium]|nr:LLM class flavin-dependent oxidoreductase [Candidatus Limnocylindrales bacterium]
MRIGVTVPLAYGELAEGRVPTFAETLAYAQAAERVELDSIWVHDHLVYSPVAREGGLHEAWTTLTGLAALVPRVELGSLVMSTSFRNAGLLAKMAATLDDLSGGRLILGLGCGWHEPEYLAFGYPFDHLVGRFEEDLEVIHRLLRGETVDFDGRWSRYAGAKLVPPPRRVPPILVASEGPRMLGLTARWADAWNAAWFGRVDDSLRQLTSDFDAACDAAGRDRTSIRRTIAFRLHQPGLGRDDPNSTDADAAGLADLFDEFEALGYSDAMIWSLPKTPAALDRIAEARRNHLARH